jgi:diguanylate cyclase (GGDEF)-like protein
MIFGLYNTNEIIEESNINQRNELISDLKKTTENFNKWLFSKKVILNTSKDLVDNFKYSEIITDKTNNKFLNINDQDEDISEIYIGLENGSFVTGSDWIPPEDYDPRLRVWYKSALSKNKTIISDIYTDRETGEKLVTISSPLFIENKLVGVIAADVFLNNINDYLENQLLSESSYAYIIDIEGNILIHTKHKDLVGKNIDELEVENYSDLFNRAKENSKGVSGSYSINNISVNGVLEKIEGIEWFIGISAEKDVEIDSITHSKRYIEIITINLILGLIIALCIFNIIQIKRKLKLENLGLEIDNKIDYLTGVFNRRYLNNYLKGIWEESEDNKYVSALMIDIDYFKKYNDTYGHLKGDEVLRLVANTIKETVRSEDVIVRYGGEEFLLLLKDTSEKDAKTVAKKIKEAIYDEGIENKNTPLGTITVSIGISSVKPSKNKDRQEFIQKADKALYRAKESGRNKICTEM